MRKPRRNDTRARANWALEVTPPRGMLSSTLGTILSLSRRSSDDLFLRPSLSLSLFPFLSLFLTERSARRFVAKLSHSFVRSRQTRVFGGLKNAWRTSREGGEGGSQRRGVGCTRKKADRGGGRGRVTNEKKREREREREREITLNLTGCTPPQCASTPFLCSRLCVNFRSRSSERYFETRTRRTDRGTKSRGATRVRNAFAKNKVLEEKRLPRASSLFNLSNT